MDDIEAGDDAWDDELLIQEYNRSVRLVDQRIEEMESGKVIGSTTQIQTSNGDLGGNGLKVNEMKKDKRRNKKKSDSIELLWKPGDNCIAVFKEDGIEYEAKIVSIDHKYGCCVVKYLGYDNEELQYLQDLKPTRGLQSQLDQMKLFLTDEVVDNPDDNPDENCELEDEEELVLGIQNLTPSRPEFVMPEVTSHAGTNQAGQEQPSNKPEFVLPPPPTFLTNSLSEPLSKENDALASMLMSWYMCGFQTGYYTALKQMKVKK